MIETGGLTVYGKLVHVEKENSEWFPESSNFAIQTATCKMQCFQNKQATAGVLPPT